MAPRSLTRLTLASSSPRRADLLREAGYSFQVTAPPVDEPEQLPGGLSPAERAEALSYFKAASVARRKALRGGLVLGADTVVTHAGRLFGKAADATDARRILEALSGTAHQVITGVTLLDPASSRRDIRHSVSTVHMRDLVPDELDRYLQSGAWVGKAGAYGVQDRADAFISGIEGSYTNVVGLPMELLAEMLDDWYSVAPAAPRSVPPQGQP